MQILWNRLLAVVEEQAQTLVRTAFSTTVREAGDLSAGVFDTRGRMLAQAITGTPGHVNAMAASVGFFLDRFPTGHLNDFTVVTPVFKSGVPVALFAATSHIADVGGLGFGPDGRQVFEEGLNIPIGYLFKAGQPNQVLLDIIRANVRDPRSAEGDLHSLAACNQAGAGSLLATLDEFGMDSLEGVDRLIVESSRQAMLDEIRKLPFGRWTNAMRIDGYDEPVDLVCAVTISEDGIDVDFEGTSPLCGHGINVPLT
jgi:N-methylhydantoinase B